MPAQQLTRRLLRRGTRLAVVFAVVAVISHFAKRSDDDPWARHPPRLEPIITGEGEVTILANRRGHYVTWGLINGQRVKFLVDTGATNVTVPGALAKKLDLPVGREITNLTAGGTTTAYRTGLDTVTVGNITIANVKANISPAFESKAVLLGMSFLSKVELNQYDSKLTLRTRPTG